MRNYLLFLNLALFLTLSNAAHAIYTIKMDDEGHEFEMLVDYKGNAHFKGMLKGSDIYYSSNKSVLYFKAEESETYYALTTRPLEKNISLYNTKRHEEVSKIPERELGFSVRTWDIAHGKTLCKRIKSSVRMAERTGFDMNDFNRMGLGLAYLLGDEIKSSCFYGAFPQALGVSMGFPMKEMPLSTGQQGFKVKSIVENSKIETIEFPTKGQIQPLNPKIHVEAMKLRLPPETLSAYLRTEQRLGDSDVLKVNALRHLIKGLKNKVEISYSESPIW